MFELIGLEGLMCSNKFPLSYWIYLFYLLKASERCYWEPAVLSLRKLPLGTAAWLTKNLSLWL